MKISAKNSFHVNDELLNKAIETLSLGQRKRVFLAGTLLPEVPVWILDEPTNGLDPDHREAFIRFMNEFRVDKTVLIASHDPMLAKDLSVSSHIALSDL